MTSVTRGADSFGRVRGGGVDNRAWAGHGPPITSLAAGTDSFGRAGGTGVDNS